MDLLGSLLTKSDEIAAALKTRQKLHIETTIRGSTKQLLESKAALEEPAGWRILRKGKRSYRLGKDKPAAEKFEDELWSIVARCGFDELSSGRKFTISVGPGLNGRQIDVFAKDHETAICIECTRSDTPKKKSMAALIEKIESIRLKAAESINAYYGQEPRLKVRWVIATRNIEWGEADLQKAEAAKIVVLRDSELDYFTKLTQQYKRSAKYQFLAHLFMGEEIRGLQLQVPATRGRMGGTTFYNFLIRPGDLLKIAYVGHKASKNVEDIETYQRMLVPRRLKEIAAYSDEGGQFPTNIVINIKAKGKLHFDKKENIGESAFGTLHLPNQYSCAWIVDGQHRLYGFAQSKRATRDDDKTMFPVLAYENLPAKAEAKLFVDINHEQVRVAKNLLEEIYANLKWDSPDYEERIDALCSRVVMTLDQRQASPIRDCLKTTMRQKTHRRCLTLTSFSEGLRENKFFGDKKSGGLVAPGPLTDSKSKEMDKTLRKAADVLSGYLAIFGEGLPEHWNLGGAKGGYLSTNHGIRTLLRVLRHVFTHLTSDHHIAVDAESAEDLLPMIEEHVRPIVDHFQKASPEDFGPLRSRGAKHGVTQNSYALMNIIHQNHADFAPPGLLDYLSTIDEHGTKEARSLIDEISRRLFIVTMMVLKDHFGEERDRWWYDGIPESVRSSCTISREKDKGQKEAVQYLYLIDYKTIASANWELFREYFSLEKGGNKDNQLRWLVRLNEVRQSTHHPEKWPATKEQVALVRALHKKVVEKFVAPSLPQGPGASGGDALAS